ncbi:MAG: HAMP domain-containing protein [Candidatus Aureabacteria bacterium]|nr:HAMP domain-containing protein [Candidatus Auribacterota bacterium]
MSLKQKFIIVIFAFMVLICGLFIAYFTALYTKALIIERNTVSDFSGLAEETVRLSVSDVTLPDAAGRKLDSLSEKFPYIVNITVSGKEDAQVKAGSDIYVPNNKNSLFVSADINREPFTGKIIANTFKFSILIFILSMIVISWVAYMMISGFILRPLERLRERLENMSRENYGKTIEVFKGQDEISSFINVFNKMTVELQNLKNINQDRLESLHNEVDRKERQMIIAQRLAATGQLAAGIAHEINNPLGGMINAVAQLRKQQDLSSKEAEYLDMVYSGLQRIRDTIRKILRFEFSQSKTSAVPVDINEVMEKSLAFIEHKIEEKKVDVKTKYKVPIAKITGDMSDLQQAFLNFLINAVDAVDDGGKIEISTGTENGFVVVKIKDNGCGIDDVELPKIFDLFYTSKISGRGVGLGLSITHNIIRNHNGMIDVRSRKGSGTEFVIKFPPAGDSV